MQLLNRLLKSKKKWNRTFILLLTSISSLSLLAGCAHPKPPVSNPTSFCEVFEPVYFGSEQTIIWLTEHDKGFIKDVLKMNETYARLCADKLVSETETLA
jgi:hypothetical protein